MAYRLSVQFAAMALNVEANFVRGSARVYAGDLLAYEKARGINISQLDVSGCITISGVEPYTRLPRSSYYRWGDSRVGCDRTAGRFGGPAPLGHEDRHIT